MNFFQRRRILKRVNFLDLRPIRMLGHETRDDGGISLLLPRFKNRIAATLFQPGRKDTVIRIKLDRFGGHTWLLIDGELTVSQVCEQLSTKFPGELDTTEETGDRVTKFLSLLWRERYITFREIQD